MTYYTKVLDHGHVILRNVAGPTRRRDEVFDANDVDPANSARFSFDAADELGRTREQDLALARYLMRNRHTTPIEMIDVWIEMQMPIFVARQFVRHRTVSINEVSARYVILPDQYYLPLKEHIGLKAKTAKQGRNEVSWDEMSIEQKSEVNSFLDDLESYNQQGYRLYTHYSEAGIPNELARLFVSVGIYTKWLWKQDLHNLMHFLSLRMDPHAQFEARQYANAIYENLCLVLPESMKLFDEFRRQ